MKKIIASVAIAFAAIVNAAGLPEGEFRDPSVANRPETWFHFIGGNVAKPGITADLEAIKGAGISGIHLFHGQFGGKWPGVEPQITCLSAPWDGLVGFVADECKRLGLTFTMQNCPGWAMSGGPWIKPENAMRHLIWGRTDVEGGKRVEVKLPVLAPSAPDPRDYRDVVVLAFPATAGEWGRSLKPANVTSNIKADWNAWQENKTTVLIDGGVTATITFDFAEPVTIRTVELPAVNSLGHGFCYNPDTTVVCEANGKTLFTREIPQANWQDDRPVTYACDETTTKQVKLTFKPRSHAIKLGKIHLFSSARNDDWEAQAGWTLRRLMRNPSAKQSEAAWVKSAEVRDVSKFMKPDGTFAWDAPAGRWAVVRVGHVNSMRRNGPAPKEGTGFECDKLSPNGANVQFDNYIGRLSGENGPVKGKMARMLMDSWECKRQTWTPGLDKVFRERLGYDLLTWMPAIFGYVVDSPEASARFLNDWRGFIGDLIADNFYAQMAKRCHDRGIDITFETAFGDVLPGDVMRFYKYADIPMCEFWQPRQHGYVGDHNFKPVYPCVSAAHLYGKKSVAAEALTSFALTWDEKLRDLKYVANLHIARGVSHMVFHTYTHNPRTDWLPPGTSFGAHIGTPFLRGQTWWKFMPDFTAYLARCQAMLEAGKPANDVLWYLGDDWDHKPDENAPFPAGYKFDYCNPDALLTRISVNDKGEWTTPDGITYRVLWVPESKRMMPETMEKILDGVQKGGKAAFAALPESISTLRGGAAMQARFDKALAAMKASKNIYVGRSLDSVLAAEKIAKDVIAEGAVWNHRRSDDADWYFLASARQGVGIAGAVGFRCEGEVEIWHPETGLSEKVYTASVKDGRTWVSLSLAPHKSCFVVFKRGGKLDPRTVVSIAKDGKTLASSGPDHMARPREICTVLEARYGDLATPGRWADVSAKLQKALDMRTAKITVGNAWAECDPAYQTPKSFSAKIRLPNGQVTSLSARENQTVDLPLAESKTLIRENGGGYPIPFESGDYTITRADGTTDNVRMSFDVTTLAGPWNVSFPEGWGMPGEMKIDALKPWKELGTTPEAKAFSGTADYTIDFTLDKVDEGAIVILDLGRVESLAKVEVNGKDFGDVWSQPYRVPLTGAVKAGKNTLKVTVTDTWYNRLVFDAGQPEAKRRTWTIAGPKKGSALRDSGLIGPVRLISCRFTEVEDPRTIRAVTPTAWDGKSGCWQMTRHAEKMAEVAKGGAKVVFIGDSITNGWEQKGRGPAQLKKYFSEGDWKMLNLGTSADRTEHVLWRLDNGELDGYEAKCVLLMIGTNNSGHFRNFSDEPPSDTILGIREILKKIRAKQPKAKVVLTAIFPRGASENDQFRLRNDVVNREIRKFCDGKTVFWCDFSDRFLDEKGDTQWIMKDRLHPGPQGYEIWYEEVKPYIEYALSDGKLPCPKNRFSKVKTAAEKAEERFPVTMCPDTRSGKALAGRGAWWLDRLLKKRSQIVASKGEIDVVFIGDSITHNWENRGKAQLAELAKTYSILDIGYGGDRTQHVIWRCQNGELDGYRAKCVMLMIGTNNAYPRNDPKDVVKGVRRILDVIAEKQPQAKVLLLPIFVRGEGPNNVQRRANEEVNAAIKSFADGKKVIWVDFNAKYLDKNGDTKWIMPDRVHPNAAGYKIWANAVLPYFRAICGK